MSHFEFAAQTISNAEFGTTFLVRQDGTITETDSIAPDDLDFYGDPSDLDGLYGGWNIVPGLSGQYGYDGPIMHESEIFDTTVLDILMRTTDGPLHVALVPVQDTEDPDSLDYGEYVGWAVLAQED